MREAGEVDVKRMRDENVVSIRHPNAEHIHLGEEFSSCDLIMCNSYLTSIMLADYLRISHQSDL